VNGAAGVRWAHAEARVVRGEGLALQLSSLSTPIHPPFSRAAHGPRAHLILSNVRG
jgi:hypothetical protein